MPSADNARSHGSLHIDAGPITDPTYVVYDHRPDRVGVQLTSAIDGGLSVFLSGTPDELHAFASEIHRHANRAARRLVRPPAPDVVGDAELPKVDEDAA